MSKRIATVVMACVCALSLLAGCQSTGAATSEAAAEESSAVEAESQEQDEAELVDESEMVDESEEVETVFEGDTAAAEDVIIEEFEDAGTTEEMADFEELMNDYLDIMTSDLSVSYLTDYVHVNDDSLYLGEGEGFTVTVTVNREDAGPEDLYVGFDDSVLNVDITDIVSEDGNTKINLYVTCNEPGEADMIITTCHEIDLSGEDAECFTIVLRQLDETEGKVVYVTPSGEKYHYSAECAGENAIQTTLYDANLMELDPCESCVN